jgi:predicted nucleic acid-binding protein
MWSEAPPPIDANIIIRFFIGGEPLAQWEAATRLVDTLRRDTVQVDLEDVIVAEVFWAMQTQFRAPRPAIARDLSDFVDLPGVHNADKPTLRRALALYGSRAIDFADALLAARALTRGGAVISFDRDFDRIYGVRRIEPV